MSEGGFLSTFCYRGTVQLPKFSGTRVMMMPLVLGDLSSAPNLIGHYRETLASLFGMAGHDGKVGYLTIDEKVVGPEQTHRRSGLHVDGVYHGAMGAWGGGGSWGSVGNGMLTVSSHAGCKAWAQAFAGMPGDEGECDHLADQCDEAKAKVFGPNEVYWVDGLCVHESVPQARLVPRQFVRLSLPSNGPWFEGYTANPLGVVPTGPILPRRDFMDA